MNESDKQVLETKIEILHIKIEMMDALNKQRIAEEIEKVECYVTFIATFLIFYVNFLL